MNAEQRIDDLKVIGRQLLTVLEEENNALRTSRHREARDLVQRKDDLSRAYESRVSGLAQHITPEDLAAVPEQTRQEVKTIGLDIQERIEENARLLSIAMEVNRRVLESVAEALRQSRPGPGTYSARGAVAEDRGKGGPALSLTLDQSL